MDRSFRSRQRTAEDGSNGIQTRETEATSKSIALLAQKTSSTSWRKTTSSEGRDVDLIGSRLLFILILTASLWLIFCEQVPTAPNELHSPWRVDIQRAPKDELMLLEGIGSSLADRILVYRELHTLNCPEDLLQVHGIGPIKIERCRRTIAVTEVSN